jgi:peptidoglycan hydrolase-like protein with peptidoglycan-binding domain
MRSLAAAVAYAKAEQAHASRNWSNLCQMFSRSCVGADAWAPSAREAFNAIPAQHRHTGIPPQGALVYFGSATVGTGHATFSDGNGYVYSTDILRPGKVDRVKLDLIVKNWGLPYRGWIDWTPSGAINIAKPITPPVHVPTIPPFPGKFGIGAKGDHVKAIQKGLGITVDGVFGIKTKLAVVAYQKRHPLLWPYDGLVGPRTYKALARPV